jgi:hypothetical protein
MKTCTKCKIEKELTEFSKDKKGKDELYCKCKSCVKEYNKVYRENNKEKIKLIDKEYYKNNSEKLKNNRKEYYINNKEKHNEYSKEYMRKRLKSDLLFKLTANIRCLIKNSIKTKGYRKNTKTESILGCSFEEFKLHLESKFEHWMRWSNHGMYNGELNYGWDIDHILPCSSAKNEEEIIKLNHYTNLQPLCSHVNRYIKKVAY